MQTRAARERARAWDDDEPAVSFEAVCEVGEADDVVGIAAAGFAHRKVRIVAAVLPLAVELRSARGPLTRLSGGLVQSADAHHLRLALHQLQHHAELRAPMLITVHDQIAQLDDVGVAQGGLDLDLA